MATGRGFTMTFWINKTLQKFLCFFLLKEIESLRVHYFYWM